MTSFDQIVIAPPGRFDGIERPYSPEDVIRLRGSVPIEHSLARRGALKLWDLLKRDEPVRALGAEPVRLSSGAGHDGQAMAKLCPIGMLFVRCRGGISHNPMEYANPQDLGLAVAALIGFIERFEPEKLG